MRHFRLLAFTFSLLTALLLSGSAFADDNLTFTGAGGNNLGGVYTYPYDFTVNGNSTQLMCDTFNNEIYNGEQWTATESGIPTGSGLFGATSSANYAAAGLIFDAMLGVNGVTLGGVVTNSNDANWAVWALFSSTALNDITNNTGGFPAGDTTALAIYNAALTTADGGVPSSDFTGITIYTPVAGSQNPSTDGTPQEFLGYSAVPEPSELSLLGVLALFGVSGFAFRKRLAPKFALSLQ
jgi:hypothetical protein